MVERLTKIDGCGQRDLIRCFDCGSEKAGENLENCGYCSEGWQRALNRLAAYEDTGLTPEEIKDMTEKADTMLLTWFEAKYGMPVGELMGLLEAKQEGRMLTLPCKVGNRVWINGILGVGRCEEHEITAASVHLGTKRDIWFNAEMVEYRGEARCSFGLDQIGKTVFLTREEAEEALRKEHLDE